MFVLIANCVLINSDQIQRNLVEQKCNIVNKIQVWEDYQLNWNVTEYGGIESIRIHPRLIWTPDLLMYNR